MIEIRKEARLLTRYGVVGIASNLTLYVVFVALVWAGVGPFLSAGLCYVFGVVLSYCFNRKWSFESTAKHSQELPKFLIAYGIGLVATLMILRVLLLWLPPEIAQILNIGCTAIVIYIVLRLLRFGEKTDR